MGAASNTPQDLHSNSPEECLIHRFACVCVPQVCRHTWPKVRKQTGQQKRLTGQPAADSAEKNRCNDTWLHDDTKSSFQLRGKPVRLLLLQFQCSHLALHVPTSRVLHHRLSHTTPSLLLSAAAPPGECLKSQQSEQVFSKCSNLFLFLFQCPFSM